MGSIFFAVMVSILAYIIAIAFVPRQILFGSSAYTQAMLDRLRKENHNRAEGVAAGLDEADQRGLNNPLVRAFLLTPGLRRATPLVQQAGLWPKLDQIVLGFLLLFLFLLFIGARIGLIGLPLAIGITLFSGWVFLNRKVNARKRSFMEQFPDALDSIVRSVKAGYPLGAAISIIGDNMQEPLGPEFRRVADETNYGWTLQESLGRMSVRLNIADVRFFTVVLGVQQESGGSLAEVLSNLSSVLRKRRQLRLKIRALSSEGRATAWVLGLMPVLLFGAVYYIAPEHMQPLFVTTVGNIVFGIILALMAFGVFMVRQIVSMEV